MKKIKGRKDGGRGGGRGKAIITPQIAAEVREKLSDYLTNFLFFWNLFMIGLPGRPKPASGVGKRLIVALFCLAHAASGAPLIFL